MPRTSEAGTKRDSRVEDVWLAEVGDHGWSQVCSTFAEASHVVYTRRRELEQYKHQNLQTYLYDHQFRTEFEAMYNHWCIWCNGEYYIGNWGV